MTDEKRIVQFTPTGTPVPAGSGNGGVSYGERLARIEAKMEHMATREDISELKVLIERLKVLIERKEATMLRWLPGLVVVAVVSLLAALLRTFLRTGDLPPRISNRDA